MTATWLFYKDGRVERVNLSPEHFGLDVIRMPDTPAFVHLHGDSPGYINVLNFHRFTWKQSGREYTIYRQDTLGPLKWFSEAAALLIRERIESERLIERYKLSSWAGFDLGAEPEKRIELFTMLLRNGWRPVPQQRERVWDRIFTDGDRRVARSVSLLELECVQDPRELLDWQEEYARSQLEQAQ